MDFRERLSLIEAILKKEGSNSLPLITTTGEVLKRQENEEQKDLVAAEMQMIVESMSTEEAIETIQDEYLR